VPHAQPIPSSIRLSKQYLMKKWNPRKTLVYIFVFIFCLCDKFSVSNIISVWELSVPSGRLLQRIKGTSDRVYQKCSFASRAFIFCYFVKQLSYSTLWSTIIR
jgi:hypothetical protein